MDTIRPDFCRELGYVNFTLYDRFAIKLSIKDWSFMCERRWFSDEPARDDVEAEFGACGAREATDNIEANQIVQNTIDAYKRMMHIDVQNDCRQLQ